MLPSAFSVKPAGNVLAADCRFQEYGGVPPVALTGGVRYTVLTAPPGKEVVATDGLPAAAPVTVKVSEPVDLGFSTDAAVMVTCLANEFGAVYVIVAVSPFPELPEFVELLNVPHAGIQALPPLVNVHVAPRNCWLLWIINAVKTCCCPAGIDATWF